MTQSTRVIGGEREVFSPAGCPTPIASAFLASCLLLVAALPLRAAEVIVFAAASLTDALKDAAAEYQKGTPDKITFNFAASSLLARQIEEGAPADIFFSADEAKMNALADKNLIVKESRKSRLANSLVIVVAAEQGTTVSHPEDLASPRIKRVALAEPKSVPAGIYAQAYLRQRNLWAGVESKIIPTENVRAALSAVEAGNADAAIVYKTDAAISTKVKVAYEVPVQDGPDISYPMALVKEGKEPAAARKFLQFLDSKPAGLVFQKFGFRLRD
jgi:molybdate transport system substrate-binding protein